MTKNTALTVLLAAGLLILNPLCSAHEAPQSVPSKARIGAEEPEVHEPIVPGPGDIKEAVGIAFFMGWIWLSILVLVYFLRLKIKEVDRLHRLSYFHDSEGPPPAH